MQKYVAALREGRSYPSQHHNEGGSIKEINYSFCCGLCDASLPIQRRGCSIMKVLMMYIDTKEVRRWVVELATKICNIATSVQCFIYIHVCVFIHM